MMNVTIYTDGACRGNPGPGGWAAILTYRGREKITSGGDRLTTNNRMELTAAIEGLKRLKSPCRVTLYSDSKYLVDAINKEWLNSWIAAGWRRGKEELKNKDLWQELHRLMGIHEVRFEWVKGHDGNQYNERCDYYATMNADIYKK